MSSNAYREGTRFSLVHQQRCSSSFLPLLYHFFPLSAQAEKECWALRITRWRKKKEWGVKTGETNEWWKERGKDGKEQSAARSSEVPRLLVARTLQLWATGRLEEQRTTLVLLQYKSRRMESFFLSSNFFCPLDEFCRNDNYCLFTFRINLVNNLGGINLLKQYRSFLQHRYLPFLLIKYVWKPWRTFTKISSHKSQLSVSKGFTKLKKFQ